LGEKEKDVSETAYLSCELRKRVSDELCPDGSWRLSNVMEKLLRLQMNSLSQGTVSEEETMYPTQPASMRAFLDTFFARHYFQVQDSLLEYMTSEEFLNLLDNRELNVLDIGSGPAVASLAITDMLACMLRHLEGISLQAYAKEIGMRYVLNDTAGICLGVGWQMLENYFRLNRQHGQLHQDGMFAIEKGFPSNMIQLKRLHENIGPYDITNFSYVVNPLNEEEGLKNLSAGLLQVEKLCSANGRILILQDRFSVSLMRRIVRAIGQSCRKRVLSQHVYSTGNSKAIYSYLYYCCLFAPSKSNIELKTGLTAAVTR
jgi:ribosomal protein RSM22 (predicted rRNA methylase)